MAYTRIKLCFSSINIHKSLIPLMFYSQNQLFLHVLYTESPISFMWYTQITNFIKFYFPLMFVYTEPAAWGSQGVGVGRVHGSESGAGAPQGREELLRGLPDSSRHRHSLSTMCGHRYKSVWVHGKHEINAVKISSFVFQIIIFFSMQYGSDLK